MSDTTLNRHLFVYGSLLSGEGHPMGQRLAREARLLGPATLKARLYAVSWYPGIVESASSADLVHGEVLALADPAAALTWLDAYEGIKRGPTSVTKPADYARVERNVRLASGDALTAWVYVYQGAVDGKRHIAGGRWSDR